VISLKKFLDTDRALEQALRRVVERLLEGIRLHTIETEPDDFAAFRGSIQQIAKAISQTESPEELLVQSGATVKTLEGYARQGAKYFGRRNAEFQNIFKMLTATIKTISAASDENLRQLREIESRVVSAVQIEDVCLMKSKLSEVLDQIRRESERQKAETSRSVEALNKGLRHAPELDPATGLHGRRPAESALERFCEAEQPWYAAVLVVDSLPSINLRFGGGTANEVLQSFGDFVAQLLSPQDQLFRWSEHTLLGILLRSGGPSRVREDFSRMMEHNKFEYTVRTSSRSVLLPITVRWAVLPMMAPAARWIHKIDSFANAQE
jgi:GGDEF domain-containing protein